MPLYTCDFEAGLSSRPPGQAQKVREVKEKVFLVIGWIVCDFSLLLTETLAHDLGYAFRSRTGAKPSPLKIHL